MTHSSQPVAGRAQRPRSPSSEGAPPRARRDPLGPAPRTREPRAPHPFARLLGLGGRDGDAGLGGAEAHRTGAPTLARGLAGFERGAEQGAAPPRTGAAAPVAPQPEGRGATLGDGQGRPPAGLEELAAFQPPLGVLAPPPVTAPQPPPAAGTASAHAEAAALADRLVTSMRVGRTGRDRHEVRMRLSPRSGAIEVRLRHEEGRLTAVLEAEPIARADAERLAQLFERELSERGLELDALELC